MRKRPIKAGSGVVLVGVVFAIIGVILIIYSTTLKFETFLDVVTLAVGTGLLGLGAAFIVVPLALRLKTVKR